MKRLIIALSVFAAVIVGCGPSDPEGPTYEQANAAYMNELAVLDSLKNEREKLVAEYDKAIATAYELKDKLYGQLSGETDESQRTSLSDAISKLNDSNGLLAVNQSSAREALDAKIADQQTLVDKAEAARDALR